MAGRSQKNRFTNTRVRFQRVSDAKLFSGWVRSINNSNVVVSLSREADVHPGEQFAFQVFGEGSTAVFNASLALMHAQELTLTILGQVRFIKSKEDIRFLVEGLTGMLVYGDREVDVVLLDLSATGGAIVTTEELAKGEKVELRIDSAQGQVVCSAEVVYCKSLDVFDRQFRVGMRLTPQNRVDLVRWQGMLDSVA